MTDYAQSASALKARWNAKNDLALFYEEVRQALLLEVEKANSALAYEELPLIEVTNSTPIELTCLGATCTVILDKKGPAIATSIVNEWGDKPVTFLIAGTASPLAGRRVSLTPETEPLVGAEPIAAAIVDELIAGAP